MRITCPSCAAEYDVPGALAPGRSVRCARCGTTWAPVAAPVIEAEPLPPPPPPPEPPTVVTPAPTTPLLPPAPAKPPRQWLLPLAWALSLVAVVALVATAFVWRDPVMRAWPPSIRAYAALGLTAPP